MRNIIRLFIRHYLRFFAKRALRNNKPKIIGITGSAGKSSARNILHSILKDHFKTKVVAENSEIGLPLGILGIKPRSLGFETFFTSVFDWLRMIFLATFTTNSLKGVQYLIIEMGIDDPYPPKNMAYLLTIVKPDIAIFLNVGAAHTMQFEKVIKPDQTFNSDTERTDFLIKKIAEEKAKIITQSGCKVGIYNADNEYVLKTIQQFYNTTKQHNNQNLLTFGKKETNDISYIDYSVDLNGTTFTFKVQKTELRIKISGYLLPQEFQQSIAAAILAATQTGLTPKQITESLEKNFILPKSRATLLHGINNSIIIDSSYNSSRIATEGMLELLGELKKQTKRPTVFLMGDMRELGDEAKEEHEIVARKLIGIVDYLYLVGPLTRQFVLPTYNSSLITYNLLEVRWFDTSLRAGEYLKDNLPKNATVLVKGSQNTIFLEEAVKVLLADKKDSDKLCRQEAFWLKSKGRRCNM